MLRQTYFIAGSPLGLFFFFDRSRFIGPRDTENRLKMYYGDETSTTLIMKISSIERTSVSESSLLEKISEM